MEKEKYSKKEGYMKDIGIVMMEHFSPKNYVSQSDLESFMKVSSGKFTIGLGQQRMRFCSEFEDVNSLAMTVTHRLLSRCKQFIPKIGRLEYATETLLDKSKSTKTILIDVLKQFSNEKSSEYFDQLEGITNLNACYGGTAAIINCINWVREQLALK